MDSYKGSHNETGQDKILYTVASTFEKQNSISAKLLLGTPAFSRESVTNSFISQQHFFKAEDIFALEWISYGKEYQKFHYVFLLRAGAENSRVGDIPGVKPGAEVLIYTQNKQSSLRFSLWLKRISQSGNPLLGFSRFNILNLKFILDAKMKSNYFVENLLYETSRQK